MGCKRILTKQVDVRYVIRRLKNQYKLKEKKYILKCGRILRLKRGEKKEIFQICNTKGINVLTNSQGSGRGF